MSAVRFAPLTDKVWVADAVPAQLLNPLNVPVNVIVG
jgi:hypothetical protein